jgi:ketosteroid isomerase-like protein
MPWLPELFTAPALQQAEDKWQRELVTVPFFDGLASGDFDALIGSFAGEPELQHPVRGRIRGARAFEKYVTETNAWLREQNASIEDVEYVVAGHRGFAEVVIHLDGKDARVGLPVLVISDKEPDGRITELRIYYSSWPLRGRHSVRTPVLQFDPKLHVSDVIAEHVSALSAGDAEAIVATFEADGYAREPAGAPFVHRGHDGLSTFYELLFSNDGGISLEHCLLTDDRRACALEYNLVRWGKTELPPQAGIVVYVRGQSGKLAAVRIYDDVKPPLRVPARPD